MPYSKKAEAIRKAIKGGTSQSQALRKYGISNSTYKRLTAISKRKHERLTEAVDMKNIGIQAAYNLTKKSDEEINEKVEESRSQVLRQKYLKAVGRNLNYVEQLYSTVELTYVNWSEIKIVARSIPESERNQKYLRRMVVVLREKMNERLTEVLEMIDHVHEKRSPRKPPD